MRTLLVVFMVSAASALAQDPSAAEASGSRPTVLERWNITVEQYYLIDPSRRPGGETFKYWRERKRGPYGNLLERIPGGPRRPVKF
jgi:hypothetical protein